jgi:hypothetical protein
MSISIRTFVVTGLIRIVLSLVGTVSLFAVIKTHSPTKGIRG